MIFAFNSILYLLLAIFTLFYMISTCVWPLWVVGVCGHMCGGCAHLACIIVTGVFRYSTEGKACAMNGGLGGIVAE